MLNFSNTNSHAKKSTGPTLNWNFQFSDQAIDLSPQHNWPTSDDYEDVDDHSLEVDDDDTDGNGMAWTADGSGVWSPVIAVVGGSGSAIDGGYATGSSIVGDMYIYQNSDGTITVVLTTINSDGSTTTTEVTYSSLESYNNGEGPIGVTDSTTGETNSTNPSDNTEPGWHEEYPEDIYEPQGGRDISEISESETVVVEWENGSEFNNNNIEPNTPHTNTDETVIVPGQAANDNDDDELIEVVTVNYIEDKEDEIADATAFEPHKDPPIIVIVQESEKPGKGYLEPPERLIIKWGYEVEYIEETEEMPGHYLTDYYTIYSDRSYDHQYVTYFDWWSLPLIYKFEIIKNQEPVLTQQPDNNEPLLHEILPVDETEEDPAEYPESHEDWEAFWQDHFAPVSTEDTVEWQHTPSPKVDYWKRYLNLTLRPPSTNTTPPGPK